MPDYDFSPLQRYLESVCDQGFAPGCEMCVTREHQLLWRGEAGTPDVAARKRFAPDTCYYLYSASKPITVTAAMQLVERGLLDPDSPVSRYLPAFAHAFVLRDGKKETVGDRLTVRNVFTMTGGLNYDLARPAVTALLAAKPEATTQDVVSAFADDPLDFVPGERFQYSLCHDVVGALIEAVSGMTFDAYLQKNIFGPLGMGSTRFAHAGEGMPDNMADLLDYTVTDGKGQLSPLPGNVFLFSPRYCSGGAGLVSTAEDYTKFADALACEGTAADGTVLLKPETVAQLRAPQLFRITGTACIDTAAGYGYGYGMGVRTLVDPRDSRSPVGEFGWDGAAGAYLLCDAQHHLSITYYQHVMGWPEPLEGHQPIRDLTYEILGL